MEAEDDKELKKKMLHLA